MKDEILKLRSEGRSYSYIQNILGCSQSTIAYHCNSTTREKAKERWKRQERPRCKCGGYKSRSAEICNNCLSRSLRKSKRDKINESTIEEYLKKYSTNTKHTSIRRLARVVMEEVETEKICKICGFSEYVELCHIKPIKDFNISAKIKEVNSLDNLVYLCPNHHKLLDTGKISL